MALPGRVFNGVENVPVEFHSGRWTIGPLTMVFPALSILCALVFQVVSPFAAIGSAVVPLILALIYIPFMNKINPGIRIRELTALRILITATRNRRTSTRVD